MSDCVDFSEGQQVRGPAWHNKGVAFGRLWSDMKQHGQCIYRKRTAHNKSYAALKRWVQKIDASMICPVCGKETDCTEQHAWDAHGLRGYELDKIRKENERTDVN